MLRHRLLAALVFLSCVRLSAQSGTLTVKVRDAATEEPVGQAQVMLSTFGGGADSHRAFTDNTGTVTLGGLSGGNYYLEVRAPGYTSSRESIDLPVVQCNRLTWLCVRSKSRPKPLQAQRRVPTS